MTVVFNSSGGAITPDAAQNSLTISNMTVGSGTNRCLIVNVLMGTNSPGATTAVWDSGGSNQSMFKLQSRSNSGSCIQQFGLRAPISGNKTLLISWVGTATEAAGFSLDCTGVDQSSDANAFPSANFGADFFGSQTGGTVTSTVTSSLGNMAICDFIASFNTISSPTQTEFGNSLGSLNGYEAQYAAGASSVAFTITAGTSGGDTLPFTAYFDIAAATGSTTNKSLTMVDPEQLKIVKLVNKSFLF